MRRRDDGFTLIELIITVTILGIIVVPLGNFMLAYLTNYTQTQNRVSDSHDIQIAAAYFSQDVANTGVRSGWNSTSPATSFTPQQSVWLSSGAGDCGNGAGITVLLLKWDLPQSMATASAAYVNEAGVLHRIYCASGATVASDATIVHGLVAATVACPTTAGACTTTPPPSTINLSLTISSGTSDDTAPSAPVVLSGQRRQS